MLPGVRLARTLVADQPNDLQMRLIITNVHSAHLQSGLLLGSLEPVNPQQNIYQNLEDKSDLSHLAAMIEAVNATVPSHAKTAFIQLLTNYQATFF